MPNGPKSQHKPFTSADKPLSRAPPPTSTTASAAESPIKRTFDKNRHFATKWFAQNMHELRKNSAKIKKNQEIKRKN